MLYKHYIQMLYKCYIYMSHFLYSFIECIVVQYWKYRYIREKFGKRTDRIKYGTRKLYSCGL